MNPASFIHCHRGLIWPTVRAVGVLATILLLVSACADPREEPTRPPDQGYTETVVLWEDEASSGQQISAEFEVKTELATISPGDTPARLTLWAYIEPDDDIGWIEAIRNDSIPDIKDDILSLQIDIEGLLADIRRYENASDAAQVTADSLQTVLDSCRIHECPGVDTTALINEIDALETDIIAYGDSVLMAGNEMASLDSTINGFMADTTALGVRRDSLGIVVDGRFTLAIWLDDDTSSVYPNALVDSMGRIVGQTIFAAETNASTGMKAKRFRLNLRKFDAADFRPGYIDFPLEINWTCYPGSEHVCLSVGMHTLKARLTGTNTRIAGTLVLVYEEELP